MVRTCWNHYHAPDTIGDAIALLERYAGAAQVLGGGTDLLLEIQQGLKPPVEAMIDPSRIPELSDIVLESGNLVIGCAVTHTRIVNDARIIRHGTCLVEGCGVIGGPQVRNVATLAGNIAHALPAGDGTIALLALGGEVEITNADGSRWVPLADTFLGPGKSTIDHHRALLTRVRFAATGTREGSAFFRIMRPQGVALPMISMAARLRLDEANRVAAIRIAIGPAGPVPYLAEPAMTVLVGRPSTAEHFDDATEKLLDDISLRTSKYRASRAYREEMIRTHLPAVLARATERATTGRITPEGIGQ